MRIITPRDTILLATVIPLKRERLEWLLDGLGFTAVGPEAIASPPRQAQEEGPSHEANAEQKAPAWLGAWGSLAIASDDGQVVPELMEQWHSLRTRGFTPSAEDDIGRAKALIDLVSHLPEGEWSVFWIEAVALADAGDVLHTFQAESGRGETATSFDPAHIHDGFLVGAVWGFPELGKCTPS